MSSQNHQAHSQQPPIIQAHVRANLVVIKYPIQGEPKGAFSFFSSLEGGWLFVSFCVEDGFECVTCLL